MAQYWAHGNQREGRLNVDKHLLETARLSSIGPPIELTTYSTMLRQPDQQATSRPYNRTLCPNPNANRMNLLCATPPFNLQRGYGTQIEKDNNNEFISLLLECLAEKGLTGKSDFVCIRNMLTKLCFTPYEIGGRFDYGMIVVVQKISGVYYLREFPTDEYTRHEASIEEREKMMRYWGLKFESYVTAKPGAQVPLAAFSDRLNLNEEFCSVVQTRVGTHSIILRGEIDCCQANGNYVELKTSKEFDHPGHERSFYRDKLIKWWLQSSILGIKKVLCGFRDENGVVKRLEEFSVDQMPSLIQQKNPSACINFLDTFLGFVKGNVTSDFVPHVFRRRAGESAFYVSLDGIGQYKFIPRWFAEHVAAQSVQAQYVY